MKKFILVLFLLVPLLFALSPPIRACGSKFLVKTFRLNKAQHSHLEQGSRIVFIIAPKTDVVEDVLNKDFQHKLGGFGHSIYLVQNFDDFSVLLKEEKSVDLVICGLAATADAARVLKDAGVDASILPVVEKENEQDVALAQEKFGKMLKDSERAHAKSLLVNDYLKTHSAKRPAGS